MLVICVKILGVYVLFFELFCTVSEDAGGNLIKYFFFKDELLNTSALVC